MPSERLKFFPWERGPRTTALQPKTLLCHLNVPVGSCPYSGFLVVLNLGRPADGIRTSRRAIIHAAALLLLLLLVSASSPTAFGDPTGASGSVVYSFGSNFSQNLSNYTLYYTVPSVVQAGVKTNMSFFVYVTVLSGWKIESQRQVLQVIIDTPTKQVMTQQTENDVTLYQGGRWGPFNMTFDLNDTQTGLPPGRAVNATVFADLVVYEAYDNPLYPFVVDSGATLKLTDTQVASTAGSPGSSAGRLLASVGVGATVVAALVGVTVAVQRRRGGRSGGTYSQPT
jgi:hypothetical protein